MEKTAPKTEDELTKQQKEIQQLFRSLCYKLDSLSNFHFTPKPVSFLSSLPCAWIHAYPSY